MLRALQVLWRAIVEFERYGWLYIVCNLFAALISIPVVTAPAAYAGLSRLSHAAQTSPTTDFSEFWSGVRQHLWQGSLMGIANIAIFGILWVNFASYGSRTDLLFVILRTMWAIVLVSWISLQLYVWPILEEMEQPDLRIGLRNAAIMALQNLGFTFVLLIGIALIVLLSTITAVPWLLLTGSLVACIANAAVIDRLSARRLVS